MPELILTCARCQRQLRVPEEMQGRLVKCPACEFTFTVSPDSQGVPPVPGPVAAPGGAGEIPRPAPPVRDWAPGPFHDVEDSRRAVARALLFPPLICLAITSVLALGGSLWLGYNMLQFTEADRQMLLQQMQAQQKNNPQVNQAQIEALTDFSLLMFRASAVAGVVLSPLVFFASVLGLNRRGYWATVAGSVLAMLNLGCCSCLLGLPFGIWSLVVLLRPETKELFYP